MRYLTILGIFALSCLMVSQAAPNTLTDQEKSEGWQLLFDGKTTTGWRSFGRKSFPDKGWVVEDGVFRKVAKVRGGDIITDKKFTDFELFWEWMIPPGANNGLKYFILEKRGEAIGHEYQLIDNSEVRNGKQKTAAFYDVLPPETDATKPPGQWNHSRIIVKGNNVEHWLNGQKVLAYELGSEKVLQGVQNSKFKPVKGFGFKQTGHILLTDHGDEANFRNIKIRELK